MLNAHFQVTWSARFTDIQTLGKTSETVTIGRPLLRCCKERCRKLLATTSGVRPGERASWTMRHATKTFRRVCDARGDLTPQLPLQHASSKQQPPRWFELTKRRQKRHLLLLFVVCARAFAAVASVDAAPDATAASRCVLETPTCADSSQTRCECHHTCQYFGSCCEDATAPPPPAAAGSGSAAVLPLGGRRRLPASLYECEPRHYGGMPTYVVSRCPDRGAAGTVVSRTTQLLVELCNRSNSLRVTPDARFWPVSSVVTGLVYRSMYCALCHGETNRTVVRWNAVALNCTSGDLLDRELIRNSCYQMHFSPPRNTDFRPSRCWRRLVDRCERLPRAIFLSNGSSETAKATGAMTTTTVHPISTPVAHEADAACQQASQALVWMVDIPFRNSHCAKCSGAHLYNMSCFGPPQAKPGISMSMQSLLDPAGPLCSNCNGGKANGTASNQVRHIVRTCGSDTFYDYLTKTCQPFCPLGTIPLDDGGCEAAEDDPAPPPSPSPSTVIAANRQPAVSLSPGNASRSPSTIRVPSATQPLQLNFSRCKWTSWEQTATAAMIGAENAAAASKILTSTTAVPTPLGGSRVARGGVASNVSTTVFGNGSGPIDDIVYAVVENASTATDLLCAPCIWLAVTAADGAVGNATAGLYWNMRWFRRPLTRASLKSAATTLVCIDPAGTNSAAESPGDGSGGSRCGAALDAIGVSLMIVSIVCLSVHAVTFIFVSSLRSVPGRVVFSQVVALLLAYVLYLSRVAAEFNVAACYALGVAVHYFLLAYFAWTLVLAVEIHGAVRALKRVYSGSRQFSMYSLAGWLLPLAFVIAALITDRWGPIPLRPGYGPPQCWMSNSYGFVIFFTGPMCVIVLADIVLYSAIIVRVALIARQTADARSTNREKAFLCAKLLLALGVLWTFAVGGAFSENDVLLCVLSNALNTSQGVFIFAIFFCADKGVRALVSCERLRTLSERVVTGASSLLSRASGAAGSRVGKESHNSGSSDDGVDLSRSM